MSTGWKTTVVGLTLILWFGGVALGVGSCRHCLADQMLSRGHVTFAIAFLLLLSVVAYIHRDVLREAVLFSLIAGVVVYIPTSIVTINSFGAMDRGRQKRTMADMRQLGTVLDGLQSVSANSNLPLTPDNLARVVGRDVTVTDGWGAELKFGGTIGDYVLISYGAGAEPDVSSITEYPIGPTIHWTDDIVFANGEFIRWPEGKQE